jgi:hypothetical protein
VRRASVRQSVSCPRCSSENATNGINAAVPNLRQVKCVGCNCCPIAKADRNYAIGPIHRIDLNQRNLRLSELWQKLSAVQIINTNLRLLINRKAQESMTAARRNRAILVCDGAVPGAAD